MGFSIISLPELWDIPAMAGVPALLGQSVDQGVSASVSTLLGQEMNQWQIAQAAQCWGIFRQNEAVLTAAHVLGVAYESRYQISTAPTENGNFTAYNKARLPSLTRILMLCDGSESGAILSGLSATEAAGSGGVSQVADYLAGNGPLHVRKDFFDTLEALVADTALYDIHMPERSYSNANIIGYRFRRDERGGVTMPVVEIALQEIRTTATGAMQGAGQGSGIQETGSFMAQTPSAASPVQAGQVQLQALPNGAPDMTSLASRITG